VAQSSCLFGGKSTGVNYSSAKQRRFKVPERND